MEKIDPALAASEFIFPSTATLDRTYVFKALTPEEGDKYEREFQTAIGN